MAIQENLAAVGKQIIVKRIPAQEEKIPRVEQVWAHHPTVHEPRTLAQFWNEVKETTGITEPLSRDEFITHEHEMLDRIADERLLPSSPGGGLKLVKSLFPQLLPRLKTYFKQQAERNASYEECRLLGAANKAIAQHLKKIKQAMRVNQSEKNPALKQKRQECLQLSLAHASQLNKEFEQNMLQWLPTDLPERELGPFLKVFGNNPGAEEKVIKIIDVHKRVQANTNKIRLKVETLSVLQSAIAEAPNAVEKKVLKNKFRKKINEVKALMDENSAVIQQVKTKKMKRQLGPRFFARFDSLKAPGSEPLDILLKRGLRLGQPETVNMLLNAGADQQLAVDELLRWKLGFLPPPRTT